MTPASWGLQFHASLKKLQKRDLHIHLPNKQFFGSCHSEGFKVEDRGSPGWKAGLSSGVQLKLCSHPDNPRTELVAEAEPCWGKEIKCPVLRTRKASLSAHGQEGYLGLKK